MNRLVHGLKLSFLNIKFTRGFVLKYLPNDFRALKKIFGKSNQTATTQVEIYNRLGTGSGPLKDLQYWRDTGVVLA